MTSEGLERKAARRRPSILRSTRQKTVCSLVVVLLAVAWAHGAEPDLWGLVPTRFAGLKLQLTPNFLPAGAIPHLVGSISSKWEDDQHNLLFYVVQAEPAQSIDSITKTIADVSASVLAERAWLPEWSWVPSEETIAERTVTVRLAEGMGYGFPTFAGVAAWTEGNLGFGLALSGAADECSRETLLACVAAWISEQELEHLPLRGADDPDSPFALFRNSRGLQYFEPSASAEYAKQALDAFQRADVPLWIAAAELQLGRMLLESRQLHEASDRLGAAYEGFQSMRSEMGQVTALISLGMLDHLQGDPVSALDRIDAAYALALALRQEPSTLTSDIHTLRGCVYFGATLWHRARQSFEEALAQDEEMGDLSRVARDENNLAVFSFATGDYPSAFDRLHRSSAIRPYIVSSARVPTWSELQDRLRDIVPPQASAWWTAPPLSLIRSSAQGHETEMNLAAAYVQLGLLDEARTLLEYLTQMEEATIAVRGAASSWIALSTISYATSAVDYLSGRLDDAVEAASRALHYAKLWGRTEPLLFTELLLGRLRLEAGEIDEAFASIASSLERCFSPSESSQRKVALLLTGSCPEIEEGDVVHWTYAWQFATLLADTLAKVGSPEKALEAAECAIALLEKAFERSQAGTEDLSSVWPLQWQHPFQVCVNLQMELGRVDEAHRTAESAKARTFLNAAQAASLLTVQPWVSSVDIKAGCQAAIDSLREREVVFEYFTTDDAVFLWVITPDEMTGLRLPYRRNDLLLDVLEMRRLIESATLTVAEQARLQAVGRSLYERLVLPGMVSLPDDRATTLVLIPSGPLWYLPFAALPLPAAGRAPAGNGIGTEYLAEEYAIAYLPSLATQPLLEFERGTPDDAWRLLGFANPTLSHEQTLELGSETYLYAQLEDAALAFARSLGGSQADVVVGDGASERFAKSEIRAHEVILFACHGSFDPLNPLYSKLYLSPTDEDDGYYHAWEVLSAERLNADIVILAACETLLPALKKLAGTMGQEQEDLGQLNPWLLEQLTTGDEVAGFPQAFLSLGASAVIGTLWQANPDAIEKLLGAFAENLGNGLPWAKALQKAQHRLLTGSGGFTHPWFWAPFQLIGSWR